MKFLFLKTSYERSPKRSAVYHVGRGLQIFGEQVKPFTRLGLAAGTGLALTGIGASFVASTAIFVGLVAGGLGVVAATGLSVGALFVGDILTNVAKQHRSGLYERHAQLCRKAGIALAAFGCAAAGYGISSYAYKEAIKTETHRSGAPTASYGLKTMFEQGLTEKVAVAPQAAAMASAPKPVVG